jgi:flavodoxin
MGKSLVAFFSAGGTTAKVAERLAKAAEADLFEIRPLNLYTEADLNWQDKESRSSLEMKDKNCRPEIWSKLENAGDYDRVYLGFPIWWYREPSIIDTFIESYDFNEKEIVPFCTSGGSGLGDSSDSIQKLVPGAKILAGRRIFSSETEDDLRKWIKEL